MSNQVIFDIRHFDDDVLVLVEDNYGKTHRSFEPDVFAEKFPTVYDMMEEFSTTNEMEGSYYIERDDDGKPTVHFDCCSSVEVHGKIRIPQFNLGKVSL